MKIIPTGERLLLKEDKAAQQNLDGGGLIIKPDTVLTVVASRVVAVGPEVKDFKVGEVVLYKADSIPLGMAVVVTHDGEPAHLLPQAHIIAKGEFKVDALA